MVEDTSIRRRNNAAGWHHQRVSDEVSPGHFSLHISQHTDSSETVRLLRFCNTSNINGDVDGKLKQQRQSTGFATNLKRNKWQLATPRVSTTYVTELLYLAFNEVPMHFPDNNLTQETPPTYIQNIYKTFYPVV